LLQYIYLVIYICLILITLALGIDVTAFMITVTNRTTISIILAKTLIIYQLILTHRATIISKLPCN